MKTHPGESLAGPPAEVPVSPRTEKHEGQSAGPHLALDKPPSADQGEPAPPARPPRRAWRWAALGLLAAVGIGVGVVYYLSVRDWVSTDDAFIDGHITAVSSRVAGHVAKVCVRDNQWVNRGDLLAELDPRDFEARSAAAEAALGTARANAKQRTLGVTAAQAELEQAQADLLAAEARNQQADSHLQRIEALVPQHAASQDSLDEARAADRVTRADLTAMRQKVHAQEAAVEQARAAVLAAESTVKQCEAEVRQTQLKLSYTKISAPISGHATRKNVEVGAYVQVGQPLLALVDPEVWVIANYKETQLTDVRPGQPVTVRIDMYPGVRFSAHVDSIQRGSGARFSLLPPENATGNYVKVVQRVPVKIVFDDPRQIQRYTLGPGMSVVPAIYIGAPDESH
jgi:membrane fusion protein (multidrug efflux system)